MLRYKKLIIPTTAISRAHALRHEALFAYALVLFLLQFSLRYLAIAFPGVLGFASNVSAPALFEETNRSRKEKGLSPLRWNESLSLAAQRKAEDMFSKDYWAHVAPDGQTPWSFILKVGYNYLYAGENLAKDFQNSQDVIGAWLASPSHRENIFNGRYEDIGLAVVNGTLGGFETTLVVQLFGSGFSSSSSSKEAAAVPAPTPGPEGQSLKGPILGRPAIPPAGEEMEPARLSYSPVIEEPVKSRLPVIDVMKLGKSVSLAFGFFLLALFALDGLVAMRRRHLRLSGHNLAHLSILLLLLAATWYTKVGTVL